MTINKDQKMTLTAQNGAKVCVRLEVNPKARRLILRLDERAREAVAVAPSRRSLRDAASFAAERVDWIASQLGALPNVRPFTDGAMIQLRGEAVRLSLEGSGRMAQLLEGEPPLLSAPGMAETFSGRVTRFLKKEARKDIEAAVARHTETLGVKAARIQIKDTRSRWGSCTSDGRLSFSWRLICAPPDVLDYVAAHECAHLLEMNHSPRFWAHVSQCIPGWKVQRKWLRVHGPLLQAIGLEMAA